MSLFANEEVSNLLRAQPLAARMRPAELSEFVGQQHFLAPGKLLWRLLKADRLSSVIFYGPPGTGKTTLAKLLAGESRCRFRQLSAVTGVVEGGGQQTPVKGKSTVEVLRELLRESRDLVASGGGKTLLFIDEIHRFNKAQQDALLPAVEDGVVTLVGATTANPFFAINRALVSRSQIFAFEALSVEEITALLHRALVDKDRGLGKKEITVDEDAMRFLAEICDGDARRALSSLEIAVLSCETQPIHLTRELAAESVQRKAISYDSNADEHYDAASALIKSLRGSDPDASLYWLARMLEGGEDIRFICRRLVILASEDVGNADPQALVIAVAAMQACEFVGLPECQLALSQAVTYLACAPKSNAATTAISAAREDVRESRLLPTPIHLKDSHYGGAKTLGHGEGYEYSHNSEDGIAAQDYLGVDREYYHPTDRGYEAEIAERLKFIREKLRQAKE